MRTTLPHRARTTLHSGAYTDQAWFQAEGDRILARMWLAAGRAAELDRPGTFITRDVAGASVLLVRGPEGRLQGFHNVCRHRGTRLCMTDAGTFADSIQCPYHAWTYGLDGALLAAPQMDEAVGFSKADYPLRPVACETWDGHIFINLSDEPPPLWELDQFVLDRLAGDQHRVQG